MKKQSINIKENKIMKINFILVNIILVPHNLFLIFEITGYESIGDTLHDFETNKWILSYFFNKKYIIWLMLGLLYLINSIVCINYIKFYKQNYLFFYWLFIIYFIYNLFFTLHSLGGALFLYPSTTNSQFLQ